MVDIAKWVTLERFSGVNNVDLSTRLNALLLGKDYIYPLQQANNVDIDNTFRVAIRPGFDDVLSGSDIHSLWSDNVMAFFVDGTVLYRLYSDWTKRAMATDLQPAARMSYAMWNDKLYYTNYYQIGYIKNDLSYGLVDPVREFKLPLPAGQLIERYKARLFVARGKTLYISDPLSDYYDTRQGYKLFPEDIRLLRAVDEGLYVGDSKVYWMGGDTLDEFSLKEAYSARPIMFTDLRVDGQHVGDGVKGKLAMWTGENGICLGDNAGHVINLTEARYTFTSTGQGAAFIRDVSNVRHYINTLF